MKSCKFLYRLQLNNNAVFNEQINPVTSITLNPIIQLQGAQPEKLP
jgi:hypothetical protein